jgi:AcrR family transcriptional regulator
MTRKGQISRDRIIEAANRLVYTKGFNQTSFADVAYTVGITKGNLHYHFKSKEELLDAIIRYRMGLIADQLKEWNQQFPEPKSRLKRFVQMLLNEEQDIVRYGCPMGSLNVELGKCQLPLQDKAREMFDLYQEWLEKVFKQLDNKESKIRSKHLLAMAQGAALMSYVYSEAKVLKDEHKVIDAWIDSL